MFENIRLLIEYALGVKPRKPRVVALVCHCGAKIEARDPAQLFAAARAELWHPGALSYVCRRCSQ